jgi:hypothetical protein
MESPREIAVEELKAREVRASLLDDEAEAAATAEAALTRADWSADEEEVEVELTALSAVFEFVILTAPLLCWVRL